MTNDVRMVPMVIALVLALGYFGMIMAGKLRLLGRASERARLDELRRELEDADFPRLTVSATTDASAPRRARSARCWSTSWASGSSSRSRSAPRGSCTRSSSGAS